MKGRDRKPAEPARTARPRGFWFAAVLIAVLTVFVESRGIDRPFYGLHSWAEASGAWAARSHVKYGLGYTHGLATLVVGDPPPENPERYVDHPQLSTLLHALDYALAGRTDEWVRRATHVLQSLVILLLFLRIARRLVGERVALLAGLLLAIFPLTGYFAMGGWIMAFFLLATWCYLVLIGGIPDGPPRGRIHVWGLAIASFVTIQFGWQGMFLIAPLGLHLLGRAAWRRQWPPRDVFLALALPAVGSLLLNFLIMAAAFGWDVGKIVSLYTWRSAKGEMRQFLWSAWFAKSWQWLRADFGLWATLLAGGYFVFRAVDRFVPKDEEANEDAAPRRLPFLSIWLLPGVLYLLVFRGILWKHQTSLRPFQYVVALTAAMALVLLWQLLARVRRRLAWGVAGALLGAVVISCVMGWNEFYAARWQTPTKIRMMKLLNRAIPPDQALLAIEDYIVDQHEAKAAFIRPEIAWYLDRRIVQPVSVQDLIGALMSSPRDPQAGWQAAARLVSERLERAKDKGPVFLVPEQVVIRDGQGRPRGLSLQPLIDRLSKKYPIALNVPAYWPEEGQVSSPAYVIFDLRSRGGAAPEIDLP